MTTQEIRSKINYLIEAKGVQPSYFWKATGAERSIFCRWRKNDRNISQNIIDKLEVILLRY